MSIFTDIGKTAANAATGGAIGMGLDLIGKGMQTAQQKRLSRFQMQGQKEMMDYNQEKQLEMWEKTGFVGQMEQLKKAGLSAGLIYGMNGSGGATVGGGAPQVQGGSAQQSNAGIEGMALATQMQLQQAQIKNINADSELKKVEAEKKAGADTKNINADTENKILQGIISKYTGMEAKDVYEKIKQPNRQIEAKTYQDELEARQGIAGNIYELWTEGKLKDKSNEEIEKLVLNNAKTREETKNIIKTFDLINENLKGAKLGNILTELEGKLQTETGIDKNSPAWMKILGRLFVEFAK